MDLQRAIADGLVFDTGRVQEQLIVLPHVLQTILGFQQTSINSREGGGMLLAAITDKIVTVEKATVPGREDKRHRFSFWPSLRRQQKIIDKQFDKDLHFIGEWHTHPETNPTPSMLDIQSMSKCFSQSKHQLTGLVMLILGTGQTIESLWVSLHTASEYKRLTPRPLINYDFDRL
jgi:integrative and conjugative element protein (TIGR02256 family)